MTAFLDIDHSIVENDLNSCVVYDRNGKKNIRKTLTSYIELLNKSVEILTILKDSISDDENDNIDIFIQDDGLAISGDPEIIDRFVGFGIAHTVSSDSESNDTYSDCDDSTDYDSNDDSELNIDD